MTWPQRTFPGFQTIITPRTLHIAITLRNAFGRLLKPYAERSGVGSCAIAGCGAAAPAMAVAGGATKDALG